MARLVGSVEDLQEHAARVRTGLQELKEALFPAFSPSPSSPPSPTSPSSERTDEEDSSSGWRPWYEDLRPFSMLGAVNAVLCEVGPGGFLGAVGRRGLAPSRFLLPPLLVCSGRE